MSSQKRILLMYITKVSGHRSATIAIERSLMAMDPEVKILRINGFGYTYPILEKVVNRTYLGVIKRTPRVWDFLYDNPKLISKTRSIKEFLHKTSHKKLDKLFNRFRPTTVVCTQAFPCAWSRIIKNQTIWISKLIGVLTDYSPHSYWINEGVDYYIVPSEEAKDRFIKKNVDADKIKVYGIPIRSNFAAQLDRKAIMARLGLNPSIPTVLVMGAGKDLVDQGSGPIVD